MRIHRALFFFCLFSSAQLFAQTDTVAVVSDTAARIFERVEIEASFPGGDPAWKTFLEKNLNANVPVENGAPVGLYTVFVQYIVNKQGEVTSFTPLTKFGYGMEQEVVRIIKKGGKWIPAMQNGKAVNAYRKQPVTFMVTAENFDISTAVQYVLFIGDNEMAIQVDRVKTQDIDATISQGTLKKSPDGKFTANVTKPGRVVVTIFNKKKNKEVGKVSFEVREVKAVSR